MATTMPMLAPDGTSGDIPLQRAGEAMEHGFKPATVMLSPDGQKGYIPRERVPDATKAGFKLAQPEQEGFWSSALHQLGLPASLDEAKQSVISQSQQLKQHPMQPVIDAAGGPALEVGKALYQGGKRIAGEIGGAVNSAKESDPYGVVEHMSAATPFLGSALRKGAEQLQPGQSINPSEAGTAFGSAINTAPIIAGAADLIPGRPTIQTPSLPKTPPISGENYTPSQLRAHAAVIAEGSPGGNPNFIPQRIAGQTSSIIRDVAAQNPAEIQAIQGSNPVAAFQAHKTILRQAQAAIDQSHDAVLQQAGNVPVDMRGVQRSIMPTPAQMQGIDPTDINVIQGLQQRAGNIQTLEGLNEFRKYMNVEDTTLRGNPTYAKSVGTPQLVHSMANATRDAYYEALQNATGQDFTALKRMEGGLIQQRGALEAATPRLTGAEAKANAPFDWRNFAGDVAEGTTRTGQPGLPVVGGIATKIGEALRGTKLSQMQRLLQNFYSNLPESPTVQLPQPRMPLSSGRLLPAQAQPIQLPASGAQ